MASIWRRERETGPPGPLVSHPFRLADRSGRWHPTEHRAALMAIGPRGLPVWHWYTDPPGETMPQLLGRYLPLLA